MEDHKPKVIFYSELIDFMHKYNLAEEMAEPRAVNISVFQHHILARIRSHAETVERAWLGSAASIKIELEGVLSQVWKLIREDNDMLDKMQRAIADGTLQTDGPENESVQLRWTIADLDDEEFLRLLEEKLSGSGHLRDIRMLMDPIMGVDDREPGPRSDRESDSDDSYTESEWVRARHAMMGVRKIVRTEKQYLRHLIAFLGDEDAVRMSSILAEHLPQMLETSRRFCACLEEDPSAKGVSEAFLDMEEALDTTFVQWSSARRAVMIMLMPILRADYLAKILQQMNRIV
ncbi:unnamed protein product [Rhizoctonia solani]|uniref:DH domain-containing protein n=1 Tax=Rhizoctonia solani TaxID=456999 RepID=A0A8H2WLJ4_9AGAM|nr:unnamed protein product [Rhizoctonia solani]